MYTQRISTEVEGEWLVQNSENFFSSLATQDQSLERGGKSAAIGDATSTNWYIYHMLLVLVYERI